ncbi:MAG: hypothetical protein JWR61_1537 [Ferruginibacter sp.]|nr:hypothetical protein [Ferruginibacter sp.]
MQKVWNKKDISSIAEFVHDKYTIHIDTGDPWEGKALNHAEFETRLHYSFSSFPDIHSAIHISFNILPVLMTCRGFAYAICLPDKLPAVNFIKLLFVVLNGVNKPLS